MQGEREAAIVDPRELSFIGRKPRSIAGGGRAEISTANRCADHRAATRKPQQNSNGQPAGGRNPRHPQILPHAAQQELTHSKKYLVCKKAQERQDAPQQAGGEAPTYFCGGGNDCSGTVSPQEQPIKISWPLTPIQRKPAQIRSNRGGTGYFVPHPHRCHL